MRKPVTPPKVGVRARRRAALVGALTDHATAMQAQADAINGNAQILQQHDEILAGRTLWGRLRWLWSGK